ncbi:MAG: hypothetical protein NVSMB42_11330 [Herpetosiphon sp.]
MIPMIPTLASANAPLIHSSGSWSRTLIAKPTANAPSTNNSRAKLVSPCQATAAAWACVRCLILRWTAEEAVLVTSALIFPAVPLPEHVSGVHGVSFADRSRTY